MNLLYTYSFWDFCSGSWLFRVRFLLVFSMHHFQIWTFQSRFPKRMWFLSRFRRFLSTFRLNLLKNQSPFENSACEGGFLKSLFYLFSNLTFQSRFPKRMRFLSRFRLNLLKNHVPFENSAREGSFLKSPFSNLTFQSPFPKRMWFLSRFRLNLLKNHVPFGNSAREGGFLISPFSNLTFQSQFPQKNAALEEIKPKSI